MKVNAKVPKNSKRTGVKRKWCRKKLNQVFFHLNKQSIKKSMVYLQLAIIVVGFIPTKAYAMSPIILVGDATQVVEKAEKACTLICQLARIGERFVHTKEGQTATMWVGLYATASVAKSLSLLVTPSLGQTAMLVAFLCASSYSISTIVGSEAIGNSVLLETANNWCVRSYLALMSASGLPKDTISAERVKSLLDLFK